ncbi:MAG: DUF5689 domain-containing protein [Bacteroidaceae bacterium]|nr:DUF5689 domain-containing protein [Bacteroidaceae bacterium]
MKKTFLTLALGCLALTACMDNDWDVPQSIQDNPPYGNNTIEKYPAEKVITIAQLKAANKSAIEGNGVAGISDDKQLQVVVNGNDAGGNLYKQISVQDETGGLIIGINATDQAAFLPVGQKLLINLKDLYIGGYGKQAQLGALYNGGIGRMELNVWKQHVRLVADTEVSAKVDTIEFDASQNALALTGRIVKISGATISGDGKQVLAPDDGSVNLSNNCANRLINGNSKTVLRTSTYSDFAALPIPKGPADIYGVCTIFNSTWQILMRTESDLKTE